MEAVAYYSTSNLGTGVVFNDEINAFVPSKQPQKIFGGEVSVDYVAPNNKLMIGTSYSYAEGLKKPSNKFSSSVRVVNLSDRQRFDPSGDGNGNWSYRHSEFPVEGYTLVDLSASLQIRSNLSASLGINNLLNEYYLPARSQGCPIKNIYRCR